MLKLYVRQGRVWYCKFPGFDGKEVRMSTDVEVGEDRKASRKVAHGVGMEKMQKHLRLGVNTVPKQRSRSDGTPPIRPTMGWALEQTWTKTWSRGRSAIVLKHVIRKMQLEIGHWYLDEVNHTAVEGYLQKLLKHPVDNPKGLSPATCNRRLSYIRKTLGDAQRAGALKALPPLPSREKEKNRKQRFVLPAEENRMLEWFGQMALDDAKDKRPEWLFMRDLTVLLVDSGFRFSEVFKFSVPEGVQEGIDGKYADLAPDETKNDEGRRVPLTRRAQVAAQAVMASPFYQRTDDPEVVAKLWDWASQRFDRCTAALGINSKSTRKKDRVTIHVLRHTTASRLVQRGVPLYTVQKWMGHKNIATTMRYAHLAPDSFVTALAALEGRPVLVTESLTGTRALTGVSESTQLGHSA